MFRQVVVHGQRGVARITTDAHVGGSIVEWNPVQRGVGLDEPAVLLVL
jgi:hypothetical protein